METVVADSVPVFSGDIVTEGIFAGMGCDFGIAGGAGGEEHEHVVVRRALSVCAVIMGAEEGILGVKVVPTLSVLSDHYLDLEGGAVVGNLVHAIRNSVVVGAHDGRNIGGLKAVFKVVSLELMGGGMATAPILLRARKENQN